MSGLVTVAVLLAGIGCTTSPTNTNTDTNTNTNTNSNSAPATQPATADTSNRPVTLPLLDAFFADESFAGELKNKLQLSDEQITRLKTIAREETGKLRETDNAAEHTGTTSAARQQAEQQIAATIGPEKAQQLYTFVYDRWSGGANGSGAAVATAATPGAVPADTRVVVNAPAFRMDIFESGRLTKTYKIGIGYPEFPLPTGLRNASSIIYNPTWTPPDEPWVEAPGSKVKVGETVKAGDKLNPLGPIKIPIGLPSLIHGGKTVAKLGNFASHGCIGLTNDQVKEFAKHLSRLGGTEVPEEKIAQYEKNKTETYNVKLNTAVPVELRYETITVEDGKLHIYRDVYDRNTNTEENLRAVLQAYGVTMEQLSEGERAQVTQALREMSRDASGRLDAQPSNANSAGRANANSSNSSRAGNRNEAKANSNAGGKVTRAIKGQKEIIVEMAALKGKGYPAPVALNAGGAAPKGSTNKTTTPARKKSS